MCGFSKDQWLNNVDKLVNEMITSHVQALVASSGGCAAAKRWSSSMSW